MRAQRETTRVETARSMETAEIAETAESNSKRQRLSGRNDNSRESEI
jgi:hypothetical protein